MQWHLSLAIFASTSWSYSAFFHESLSLSCSNFSSCAQRTSSLRALGASRGMSLLNLLKACFCLRSRWLNRFRGSKNARTVEDTLSALEAFQTPPGRQHFGPDGSAWQGAGTSASRNLCRLQQGTTLTGKRFFDLLLLGLLWHLQNVVVPRVRVFSCHNLEVMLQLHPLNH